MMLRKSCRRWFLNVYGGLPGGGGLLCLPPSLYRTLVASDGAATPKTNVTFCLVCAGFLLSQHLETFQTDFWVFCLYFRRPPLSFFCNCIVGTNPKGEPIWPTVGQIHVLSTSIFVDVTLSDQWNRFLWFHDNSDKYVVNDLLPTVLITADEDLTFFIHHHLYHHQFPCLISSS